MPDDVLYGNAVFLSYEEHFFKQFPPATQFAELVKYTDRWVTKVKVHIEMLEEIFLPVDKRRGVLKALKVNVPSWCGSRNLTG